MPSSERITVILALLAVLEVFGVVFAVALCRAAAKRPVYGPAIGGE